MPTDLPMPPNLPMPTDIPARRAWTAAAVLAHNAGTCLSAIMTLANTKAEAMSAAITEAERNLPRSVGDAYTVLNSHATAISPDVIRAANDELNPTESELSNE